MAVAPTNHQMFWSSPEPLLPRRTTSSNSTSHLRRNNFFLSSSHGIAVISSASYYRKYNASSAARYPRQVSIQDKQHLPPPRTPYTFWDATFLCHPPSIVASTPNHHCICFPQWLHQSLCIAITMDARVSFVYGCFCAVDASLPAIISFYIPQHHLDNTILHSPHHIQTPI
jgi:hypothetical protein